MHVLLVPSWYPEDAADPNGSFFREQAQILAAAGHRVTVLAAEVTAPDVHRPSTILPALRGTLRMAGSEQDGVRVLRLRLPVPLPGVPGEAAALLAARAVRTVGPQVRDVDVVHAHSMHPGATVARALAHRLDVPWLLTEHRPSAATATRRPRFDSRLRSALTDADVLSAVSGGLGRALEQRFALPEHSVHLLPNPLAPDIVDATAALPGRGADGITRFVHLSHLSPIKRVEDVIAAFRARTVPGAVELVIAGGRPQRVQELAASTGSATARTVPGRGQVHDTGSDVVLVGHTPREDVPALMSTADRFVLASAQESFGIVLAEALACGIPVIATDTWGARDVVGEDARRGTVVPVGDVGALRAAMDDAMVATSEGQQVPVPALRKDVLDRYSPAAYTTRVEELWRLALDGHPRPGRTTA